MYSLVYILLLLLLSCNSNSTVEIKKNTDESVDTTLISKININQKWDKATQFRKKSQFMECITLLKEIISYKNNDSLSIQAQYQIADIYLNDINDYPFAIQEFKHIINNYPDSDYSKKSIFMLGYINANHMHAYSDAIDYYNMFLEKYPSDELSHSVKYELDILDSLNITEDFNKLNQE